MAQTNKEWFSVSRAGLRELQAGKPKHFVARELIQNAWDEAVDKVHFDATWENGVVCLDIEDDSPEGFKDLRDAFTLFAPTYKRAEPEKRGRFNIGEKQVLAVCEEARIRTTKGGLVFDRQGRRSIESGRDSGSQIVVWVKMTKAEFNEMLDMVKTYLVPKGIDFTVNGEAISFREPHKRISVALATEILDGDSVRRTIRKTAVHIHKTINKAKLYEMGIPVTEIDCEYDLDVQQKVPLSTDRDTVSQGYLVALYAEVLNAVCEEIRPEQSSQAWIREGAGNRRVTDETVKTIVQKRYGDKVVVADSFNPQSIDDAISAGYRVVYGSELSREEWAQIKVAEALPSSSSVFQHPTADTKEVDPTIVMDRVGALAKKIAMRCLGIEIDVRFASWSGVAAQFGNRVLTFNVQALRKGFFGEPVSERTIDLIVHEICHHVGHHTEKAYLDAITKMAGQLAMLALEEPEFFRV